jgi:uncharacterized protein (TIGR02147 family)
MVSAGGSYRDILKREFEHRSSRNAKYSLRAFAKFLGISQSRLSEILSGKQGLSREWAERISEKLNHNGDEKKLFADLVEAEHARSSLKRKLAHSRLSSRRQATENTLQLDVFHVISDWYHFGITELALTKGFKSDPVWIAKRLGVAPKRIELAIERLLRLGLLARDSKGALKADDGRISTTDGVPSDAIKKFHAQVLSKAAESIYSQTVSERSISTIMLPFHAAHFSDAEKTIKKFRKSFSSQFDPKAEKDSVYCLAVQFFRMDQKIEGTK